MELGKDDIVKKLSLKEKARQLTQINADFIKVGMKAAVTGVSAKMKLTEEDIFGCGSVLNFGDAADAAYIRGRYLEKSENKIPLVMMQDVIHGYRTIFPVPLALACSFDTGIVEECCKMAGVESSLNGVDVTFSPVVNLVRDARWGRVMETYGEDPYLNGVMGRAAIRGYRAGGLGSCVKHFAVYGAAEAGREYNTTDVSEHSLREYYLPVFYECLKEEPEVLMTSFNLLNGVPVNADSRLLNDILRKEWGYEGVVVSDYGAVVEMINHGYAASEKECAKIALNNNIDLEMMTDSYIRYLPELVEEGEVDIKTVDEMVGRVIELKRRLNLFDNPLNATDVERAKEACLCPEHREIARRAAEASFVLLENNGVLPLSRESETAFVGPFAAEKNILGAWACAGRAEEAASVKEAAEKFLSRKVIYAKGCEQSFASTDESLIAPAVGCVKGAVVVVACVGEHSWCSGESASRTDISIPAVQIKLLGEIKKAGKKVVAVVFGGRPQVLTALKPLADAILYVWQPGTEGGAAIINTLYGLNNPAGKLTMSFPRSVGQCPIYYNNFNTGRPKTEDTFENSRFTSSYIDEYNSPLYPFGYGLSYTRFVYSGAGLSSRTMKRGETLTAFIKLKNAGDVRGSETVQLYIRDKFASCARPVRELKKYAKITLEAGEERTVEFTVDEDMLAFYGADGVRKAEAGDFDVFIGGDSACGLAGTFNLLNK